MSGVDKIRVMHLLAPITFAGAERVAVTLLRCLDRDRFEPSVCLQLNARRPDELTARELRRLGLEPETIFLKKTFEWRQVKELAAIIKRERIDVLHTHGYRTDVTGYLASKLAPVKLVATAHGWITNSRKARFYHLLQKLALRSFDQVIAVSEPIAAELRRCGVKRLIKIANAVELPSAAAESDLRRQLGLAPQAQLIGTVGRLSPEKGLHHLLEAAVKLSADLPEALFLIVGDGPARTELEALSASLGLSGRVIFHGYCADVAQVYPALDLFVLPSLTEGMPMALLEALSYGVPVVATRVGEVPALLGDGRGRLVSPGRPEELAQAISGLLADPAAARAMAGRARQHLAEHYSLEAWRKQIEGVYEKVLAAGPAPVNAYTPKGAAA